MEWINEIFNTGMEDFDTTNVNGFEGCKDYSNEMISDYLSEVIPHEHFTDCPSITYNPENPMFVGDASVLGVYNIATHEINIADESRFENSDGMLDAVVHEVGHNAYSYLEGHSPEVTNEWDRIHEASYGQYQNTGLGFVSTYAQKDKFEDFSETYNSYIRNPELLQFMSPEKYEFMRDYVFDGREYSPQLSGEASNISSINRQIGSSLEVGALKYQELLQGPEQAPMDISILSNSGMENDGKLYRCFDITATQ